MATDYRALLSRKVAGIPVYVFALIVAAAVLYGAIKLRSTPAAVDPAAAPEGDTTDTGGDLPSTSQPVFNALAPTPVSVTAATPEQTNESWGQGAITFLVSGGVPYSEASSAITQFLNGNTLSYEQGVLRDKAIAQFGIPPEPLSSSRTSAYKGPASKQGEPPLSHLVKGKSDDSAPELARLYYGFSNTDGIRLIRAANAGLAEPYAIGASIRIPRFHAPRYYRANSHIRSLYQIARKNSVQPARIAELNPGMQFPVKSGTRVRVA